MIALPIVATRRIPSFSIVQVAITIDIYKTDCSSDRQFTVLGSLRVSGVAGATWTQLIQGVGERASEKPEEARPREGAGGREEERTSISQ